MKSIAAILIVLTFMFDLSLKAHKMTEQYIPIGKSPGISHQLSSIGIIESLDRQAQKISVKAADGSRNHYKISDKTWIWLDNSKLRKSNASGRFDDCEIGQRVEVKPVGDKQGHAEWVKVELIMPKR